MRINKSPFLALPPPAPILPPPPPPLPPLRYSLPAHNNLFNQVTSSNSINSNSNNNSNSCMLPLRTHVIPHADSLPQINEPIQIPVMRTFGKYVDQQQQQRPISAKMYNEPLRVGDLNTTQTQQQVPNTTIPIHVKTRNLQYFPISYESVVGYEHDS